MATHTYGVPLGEAVSGEFSLTANGLHVPVHGARVSAMPFNRRWPGHQRSADQSEPAYFASLETDEPVQIRVAPKKAFRDVVVRPLSRGITPRVQDGAIEFTVTQPGGYTVELDGFHNALHLFVDPLRDYAVNPADENTLYFGPGMHDAGMIHLQSNQTVYIDRGAVVFACIHAKDAENIRILGRGILDNSKNVEQILFQVDKLGAGDFDVRNSKREHTIHLVNVKNAEIDGITIRDSLVYNVAAFRCENLLVNNIKTIGCWRYNSDGIDLHNCSHCVIRGCFVRTYDDSICVKGHVGYPQICEDILVENCTVWCDWGRALEIGAETCAEEIRNVTFRNCDLIRNTHVAMDVQSVDYADIHDIRFEDIRVEYDPVSQRSAIQRNDEDVFVPDPNSDYMPELMVSVIHKHPEYSEGRERRGINHAITLRDIQVFARRMPPSYFAGYDERHMCYDIAIRGLTRNGARIETLADANVTLGSFARDITIG